MSERTRSRGKKTDQCTHCAMKIMKIIITSNQHKAEKTDHMLYFQKRRGLKVIEYNVPVFHFYRKMIIQEANLLGPVHILKPYNFWVPHSCTLSTYIVHIWLFSNLQQLSQCQGPEESGVLRQKITLCPSISIFLNLTLMSDHPPF